MNSWKDLAFGLMRFGWRLAVWWLLIDAARHGVALCVPCRDWGPWQTFGAWVVLGLVLATAFDGVVFVANIIGRLWVERRFKV